ncbi:MAG: hypothetical protein Q6373_012225 [Candidatus Sigynarchaeota archaeon]
MVEGPRKVVGSHKTLYKDEHLESAFEAKDRNNLEVSFDYLLHKGVAKEEEYSITGYFFIPPELKISKDTYTKQMFFHDVQSQIRFQTPHFPLKSYIDPGNKLSPLNRIQVILQEMVRGKFDDDETNERLVYELKMHAQIVRSNLKSEIGVVIEMCSHQESPSSIIQITSDLLDSVNKIQDQFHKIENDLNSMQLPRKTRETYHAADEYVSYYIEHYMTLLLETIKDNACFDSLINAIHDVIVRRQERREAKGYTLVIDPDVNEQTKSTKNTKIHYWKSFLKFFIKQVLVLETREREERKMVMQIIGTIGAIIAMSVFVIFTFFFLGFGQFSVPFVLATLVFYAIKDRTKVMFNAIGERISNKMIPDKVYDIVDTLKKKDTIGSVKESMQFIKIDQVPDEVLEIRNKDRTSSIENEYSQENVILYRKHIKLNTSKITHIHERHKNITDMLKINIKNFLLNAWDPEEEILYYNRKKRELTNVPVPIRYHMNMVLQQEYIDAKNTERKRYKRIRVVFQKDGIDDVEEISV